MTLAGGVPAGGLLEIDPIDMDIFIGVVEFAVIQLLLFNMIAPLLGSLSTSVTLPWLLLNKVLAASIKLPVSVSIESNPLTARMLPLAVMPPSVVETYHYELILFLNIGII